MRTYTNQFPEVYHDIPDDIPSGFVDDSWGNDVCPSWWHRESGVKLWIDAKDPNDRECPGMCRFIMTYEGGEIFYESDSWEDILCLIATYEEDKFIPANMKGEDNE